MSYIAFIIGKIVILLLIEGLECVVYRDYEIDISFRYPLSSI